MCYWYRPGPIVRDVFLPLGRATNAVWGALKVKSDHIIQRFNHATRRVRPFPWNKDYIYIWATYTTYLDHTAIPWGDLWTHIIQFSQSRHKLLHWCPSTVVDWKPWNRRRCRWNKRETAWKKWKAGNAQLTIRMKHTMTFRSNSCYAG
jgi:hypothetical protein